MSLKPGDKLQWGSQSVIFVGMVEPPKLDLDGPPALIDVYVPAAWVRRNDQSVVPVPLDQLSRIN